MLHQVSSATNSNNTVCDSITIPPLSWNTSPFANFNLDALLLHLEFRRDAIFIPSRFNLNNVTTNSNENTQVTNTHENYSQTNLIPCEFCNNLIPASEYRQHTSMCYGTNFIEEMIETVIETANTFSQSNTETSSNLVGVNLSV